MLSWVFSNILIIFEQPCSSRVTVLFWVCIHPLCFAKLQPPFKLEGRLAAVWMMGTVSLCLLIFHFSFRLTRCNSITRRDPSRSDSSCSELWFLCWFFVVQAESHSLRCEACFCRNHLRFPVAAHTVSELELSRGFSGGGCQTNEKLPDKSSVRGCLSLY